MKEVVSELSKLITSSVVTFQHNPSGARSFVLALFAVAVIVVAGAGAYLMR